MTRRLALLLGAAALLSLGAPPARVFADTPTFLGPTRILLVDADTVLTLVTREWLSAKSRQQERPTSSAIWTRRWGSSPEGKGVPGRLSLPSHCSIRPFGSATAS